MRVLLWLKFDDSYLFSDIKAQVSITEWESPPKSSPGLHCCPCRCFSPPRQIHSHVDAVWTVLGPRHHSHPRDGAQMLSKGPQRKTRVRTDLYTQKVKFCNFCCFPKTTFDLHLEKAAIPWLCVQLQSFEEAEVHPVHQVDPGVQRWGRWARRFLYFLHCFLYIFCVIFLNCFLCIFFSLLSYHCIVFLHFFLWIAF